MRKPKERSIDRASGFGKTNVIILFFFSILKEVLGRLRTWPSDETCIRTMQTADRIIARYGCKQIRRLVSAERRKLVSLALAFQRQETQYRRFPLSRG